MDHAPVLLLGYNRPDKMLQLINALSSTKPQRLLIGVDGPNSTKPADAHLVKQTQDTIGSITWPCEIRTRFRPINLGLKNAVVDSVSWAISEFGQVIILEDDAIPGPQFVPYACQMLKDYCDAPNIAHINGYNIVPPKFIQNPDVHSRLTRFPESYAWATWDRAWNSYYDSLDWAVNCPISKLIEITGSRVNAMRWRLTFRDAASGRINTWAYRWLATMWSNNWKMLAPNRNLVAYSGWTDGTHTRRKPKWSELPIKDINFTDKETSIEHVVLDAAADAWLGKKVFGESPFGLAEGVAATIAMSLLKHRPRQQKKLTL